jgi:RNA polymerase sigma factor (sigma-70 family)
MPTKKKGSTLTQAAFDKLLAQFDRDPERAGEKYEQIRVRIIKFFECRGSAFPQDLADETITRVAFKILEGADICDTNFSAYFYGVARNVFKEHLRSPDKSLLPIDLLPRRHHPTENPEEMIESRRMRQEIERQLECLETCIESLPQAARKLAIAYYEMERSAKIEYRKQLAETLGLSTNSLRIRIHRIREKLEKCVDECIDRARV